MGPPPPKRQRRRAAVHPKAATTTPKVEGMTMLSPCRHAVVRAANRRASSQADTCWAGLAVSSKQCAARTGSHPPQPARDMAPDQRAAQFRTVQTMRRGYTTMLDVEAPSGGSAIPRRSNATEEGRVPKALVGVPKMKGGHARSALAAIPMGTRLPSSGKSD